MKLLVIIPSHSDPVYTKITIASLVEKLGEKHELNIHVGVHSNYSDYTKDFSLFEDLLGIAQIHLVDELDWMLHFKDILRYSKMHCLNLKNLLNNCKYYDFDYVIHLDNDVLIKDDFISDYQNSQYDLIFDYFNNDSSIRKVDTEMKDTEHNGRIQFAPKITAWNLIFSRKIFDRMISNTDVYFPEKIDDSNKIVYYKKHLPELDNDRALIFDTFAKLLFYCQYVWNDVKIFNTKSVMTNKIHHFFHSSFNYGVEICHNTEGVLHATRIWENDFKSNFKTINNSLFIKNKTSP